jgi:hypothetical protein
MNRRKGEEGKVISDNLSGRKCDLSGHERSSLNVTEETITCLENELKRSNAICRQADELCYKWADQQKALKQQGIPFDMETYIKLQLVVPIKVVQVWTAYRIPSYG